MPQTAGTCANNIGNGPKALAGHFLPVGADVQNEPIPMDVEEIIGIGSGFLRQLVNG